VVGRGGEGPLPTSPHTITNTGVINSRGSPLPGGYFLAYTSFNISASQRKIYSVGKPIWGISVQIWDSEHRRLTAGRTTSARSSFGVRTS